MWLDGPPAVGTAGGHGALRYRVTDYEPGRRIVFTLDPGQGLSGWHGFEVVPRGPGPRRAAPRRRRSGPCGGMRLLWPCVVRPVHDGIVEQILDRAEIALGTGPERPTRLSVIARLARWAARPRARATDPPAVAVLPGADFVDAFAVRLRPGMPTDPVRWASAVFDGPPRWVGRCSPAAQALVGLVGIERADRSVFAVRDHTATTAVVGADARHLDFRAVVTVEPTRVVLTTVVRRHNLRGTGLLRAGTPDPPGGRRGDAHPGGDAVLPPARRCIAFSPEPFRRRP